MMIARRLLLAVCMLCVCAGLHSQEQKGQPPQPAPADNPQLPPDQPSLPKIQSPQQIHVEEGATRGSIIKKVLPNYPKEARKNRVQGTVVLQVLISKTGDVADMRVISGDELLVPAAIKAVKQWKYKPYLLKGQPIEVQTRITLNFTLH
jgi:TonB family protein